MTSHKLSLLLHKYRLFGHTMGTYLGFPLRYISLFYSVNDCPNQAFHGIMEPFAALQVPLVSPVVNIVLLIHPVSSSKGCRSYFWSSLISGIFSMLCAILCQQLVSRPRDRTVHGLKTGNNNHT